jgi:hypothetical protein
VAGSVPSGGAAAAPGPARSGCRPVAGLPSPRNGDLTTMRFGGGSGLLTIVYLVIGAIVAGTHHYFVHVSTLQTVVSAVLAVLLWPLLLLGVDLHVHF